MIKQTGKTIISRKKFDAKYFLKPGSSSRVKLSTFLARGLVGQNVEISVVDPNTLNFDPDPEFWPNLNPDPYPDLGLCYQF